VCESKGLQVIERACKWRCVREAGWVCSVSGTAIFAFPEPVDCVPPFALVLSSSESCPDSFVFSCAFLGEDVGDPNLRNESRDSLLLELDGLEFLGEFSMD